jgi:hypothetical protein
MAQCEALSYLGSVDKCAAIAPWCTYRDSQCEQNHSMFEDAVQAATTGIPCDVALRPHPPSSPESSSSSWALIAVLVVRIHSLKSTVPYLCDQVLN